MVARKALLLFSIVLLWAVWQAARINAVASPPDLLSPRPIHECLTLEGDPAPCHDDEIRTLDASIDGRVVSFASGGNRFVPADTNGFTDIFVWQDGSVQRVSVGANGEQTNHDSDIAAISGNG